MYKEYNKINFIQIKEEECYNTGFINSCTVTIPKNIVSWDKALYYLSKINKYSNMWLIEDDVFLYDETTLMNIDSKYKDSDLLSAPYDENTTGHKNYWHWWQIEIQLPPPYYKAMICAIRISNTLLSKIKDYVEKHKTFFFCEAFFPTICKSNGLLCDTPIELENIVYRKDYTIDDINTDNLYHPLKDINTHELYRNNLKNK